MYQELKLSTKKLLYKSPIFQDAFKDASTIHVSEVEKIIRAEYANAGIKARAN